MTSGTIEVAEELGASTAEVTIDAASVDTGAVDRDAHLRSPDFLDAERFPELRFRATRVERGDDDGEYRILGDLTIRDGRARRDLQRHRDRSLGNLRAGLEAGTSIDRKDWGLTWNTPLEAGGILVGNEVKITMGVSP